MPPIPQGSLSLHCACSNSISERCLLCRFGGQKIVRRRIISWLAYVALLGLSLFVMINLNILATVETNDVLYKALTVKNQVVARRVRILVQPVYGCCVPCSILHRRGTIMSTHARCTVLMCIKTDSIRHATGVLPCPGSPVCELHNIAMYLCSCTTQAHIVCASAEPEGCLG